MKTTLTLSTFVQAFRIMNRTENFSYEGLEALFNYFEDIKEAYGDCILLQQDMGV